MNAVFLRGRLSRPAQSRVLDSGDLVVNYEVTVTREDAPAESVPVVWHDAPVKAADYDAGDEIVVVGRVRRRFFRAGGSTQSRTEVVVEHLLPARQVKKVASVLAERCRRLAGG
jgi:single-strand DNA-binding protein